MIIPNNIDVSGYSDIVILITAHNRNSDSHSAQVYFQSNNTYSHIHTSIATPGPTGQAANFAMYIF